MSNQSFNFNNLKYKLKSELSSISSFFKKNPSPSDTPSYSSVDLRPWLQPVRNQGEIGDCFCFAAATIPEYYAKKTNVYSGWLSPWFIYSLGGGVCNGEGTMVNSVNVLQNKGIALEDDFPTPDSCLMEKLIKLNTISDCIYENAKNFRVGSIISCNSINEIKNTLIKYGPVIIGVSVYNGSPQSQMWKPGSPGDRKVGGHNMVIVGYDSNSFIVRNSWGVGWANGGYSNLYFTDYKYIETAFTFLPLYGNTSYNGLLIPISSIISYTLIGLCLVCILIYAYYYGFFRYDLHNMVYYFGRDISHMIFFTLLIITTIVMADTIGMTNIFIINLSTIGVYIIYLFSNLYIKYRMKNIL
jgi:hypothetical protein